MICKVYVKAIFIIAALVGAAGSSRGGGAVVNSDKSADIPSVIIAHRLSVPGLELRLSRDGEIVQAVVGGNKTIRNVIMGYRLEMMRDVDGFYDEAFPMPREYSRLNGIGLLALRKPAIMWTGNPSWVDDAFFQRHLYLGIYSTAPFPGNDHCINPDPRAEKLYMDYGRLMDAIRGKKWTLSPHCIEVADDKAKANLFEVPGGWAAPVMFGPAEGTVSVLIRNVPGLKKKFHFEVLHPGTEETVVVPAVVKAGVIELQVPLKRGCAMVRIESGNGSSEKGQPAKGVKPLFTPQEVAAYRPKGSSKCFRQICLEYNSPTRAKKQFAAEELDKFFSEADPVAYAKFCKDINLDAALMLAMPQGGEALR